MHESSLHNACHIISIQQKIVILTMNMLRQFLIISVLLFTLDATMGESSIFRSENGINFRNLIKIQMFCHCPPGLCDMFLALSHIFPQIILPARLTLATRASLLFFANSALAFLRGSSLVPAFAQSQIASFTNHPVHSPFMPLAPHPHPALSQPSFIFFPALSACENLIIYYHLLHLFTASVP